jgi:CelD/BcsL family acetyltransferase involved in cellulose biosynthesis
MKKQLDKQKRKFDESEERGGHNYKRLRTEQQRKANNVIDQLLKRKNFNFRPKDDEYDYF